MTASIRPATASNIGSILPLYRELHDFSAVGVPTRLKIESEYDDPAGTRYVQDLIDDPTKVCLLATDDEEILGVAEARIVEPEKTPGVVQTRRGYLQSLVVTPSHRGIGIGLMLLRAAEDWARDMGAEEMDIDHWVFDGDPGPFYDRAGYSVISHTVTRRL